MFDKTMFALLVIFISLSSSVAQRSANNTYPTYELSLDRLMPTLMANTTDNSTFFHAIPAQLYYNTTTPRKPLQEVISRFNLTALTPQQMAIVLAFPSFPQTTSPSPTPVTADESFDSNLNMTSNANQTHNEERDDNLMASPLPISRTRVRRALPISPFNWFQRLRSAFKPTVINNYYIQRRGPQYQYVRLPDANGSADVTNGTVGTVRTAYYLDTDPDLKNVDFNGVHPIYPSFPLVPINLTKSEPKIRPDYPSTDMQPPVLEVLFS